MKLLLRLIWPTQGLLYSSMFITRPFNVMHVSVNFHKYIPYGLEVMAHTHFTIWN